MARPAAPSQPKGKGPKPQESSEDDESSEEDSRPPAKTGRSRSWSSAMFTPIGLRCPLSWQTLVTFRLYTYNS